MAFVENLILFPTVQGLITISPIM